MNSALNIVGETSLLNHSQKGYFCNMITGLPTAKGNMLIPFFKVLWDTGVSRPQVTYWKLEQLDGDGGVMVSYDITTSWLTVVEGTQFNHMIYNADRDILSLCGSYTDGIYRFKFNITPGVIYYSEIFEINTFKFGGNTPHPSAGDFDPTDFNDDFFTS